MTSKKIAAKINMQVGTALKAPVALYRYLVSPLLGPACRFHPSCSEYALEALDEHGAAKGLALSIKRLLKCQPLHPGGYDPVPTKRAAYDAGRVGTEGVA